MKARPPVRARLLETALRLFYAEGIRAVGIDRIIAEAGVAKKSFYNHFPSKDALVLAFVEARSEAWRAWMAAELSRRQDEGVLAIFDALAARFRARDFRGCPFINTMVEVADADSAAHAAAAAHKHKVIDMLEAWLRAHGETKDVRDKAYQLMLVVDGAIVTAVRDGGARPLEGAKAIARAFLPSARA
jgi:AcrR family transcriptional regulator